MFYGERRIQGRHVSVTGRGKTSVELLAAGKLDDRGAFYLLVERDN